MTSTQQKQVDVTELDLKQQLELEIKQFTVMFGQLRVAQTRFQSCLESVGEISPASLDKVSLLPLTASLYVPGRLSDPDTVIVDIGTGYYVEKKLYKEKVAYVTKNMEQLQDNIHKKQDNMRVVGEVMQVKLAQQQKSEAQASS